MKKSWNRVLAVICVLALCVGLMPAAVAARPMGEETAEAAPAAEAPAAAEAQAAKKAAAPAKAELMDTKKTIWLVGDSTVCDYPSEARYVPRNGYGQALKTMVDNTKFNVENIACSGTSSKDFPTNSKTKDDYDRMVANIAEGDYLIIGFGHNDEKSDDASRYTTPSTDNWESDSATFAYNLYNNFVKKATDKGATAILCTPIARRSGDMDHTKAGNYPGAIKAVGTDKSVPVIDLTTLTNTEYTAQTPAKTQYLHSWESSKKVDDTHLNAYGAKLVAWLFANEVKTSSDPKLAALAAALTPGDKPAAISDKDDPLFQAVINPDVPALPEGYQPCPKGENKGDKNVFKDATFGTGNDAVSFYGTVLGLGVAANTTYNVATIANDSIRMDQNGNKGKISNGGDGFFMYYYPVPADAKSYTLTATAKVNRLSTNNQAAFGLMIRDDMYINSADFDTDATTEIPSLVTPYVAAATRGDWQSGSLARNDSGAFVYDTAIKDTGHYKVGDTIQLSVSFNGDNYTTKFGNETAKTFDTGYSMVALDADYAYVGMFVARDADVTFADIHLTVDGEDVLDLRRTYYDVSIGTAEHGTGSADLIHVTEGETITLSAAPAAGYVLDHWEVKDGDNANVDVADNLTFTMPASNVTATPVFVQRSAWDFTGAMNGETNGALVQGKKAVWNGLYIDASVSGAKFDTKNVASLCQFNNGTVLQVPVTGPSEVTIEVYSGGSIEADGALITGTSHTLETTGADKWVTIEAVTTGGYLKKITVTPKQSVTPHTVTVNVEPEGAGTVTATPTSATKGHKVALKVEAASGYEFDAWEVVSGGVSVADNAFVMGEANVTLKAVFTSGARKIDVWDFAGEAVSDADGVKYTNRIAPTSYANIINTDATLKANGAFGDLTLTVAGGDRIYSDVSGAPNYGNWGTSKKSFPAGKAADAYTSKGCFYSNGTGGTSRRYVEIAKVQAGDTLVFYAGSGGTTAAVFKIEGSGTAAGESMTYAATSGGTMEFIAKKAGTYKFYATVVSDYNGQDKPCYYRVMRIPGAAVTGKVTGATLTTGSKVRFENLDAGLSYEAALDAQGNYSISLPVGVEFTAQLSGVQGYGIVNDEGKPKKNTMTKAMATSDDGVTWNLSAGEQTLYKLTATFTGFAQGASLPNLKAVLTPEAGSGADPVKVNATTSGFEADLYSNVVYTLTLEGANDYMVPTANSNDKVTLSAAGAKAFTVAPKTTYAATGKFITLDPDDLYAPLREDATYPALPATVTALKFTNVADNYEYTATIANGGYSVNLRDGAYAVAATVNGYTTKTHVVVNGKAVNKDILFKATAAAGSVGYAADLYVNPKSADGTTTFKTITGAVNYAGRMNRTATQWVTIHITPGVYREQFSTLGVKNLALVNANPKKEVKITWYYGIGYKYYSSNGTTITPDMSESSQPNGGFYDPELAYDRYNMATAGRWGCTIQAQASGLRMENITLENSFNYYMTDEELLDGVAPSGVKDNHNVLRDFDLDVTGKNATERAAVLWVDTNSGRGDMCEFKNCKFLSSQDTIITGNRMYFKDCFIEGMTDYICGPGDCVFDTCQMNWKGYSDSANGGYVTAPQTGASEKGYLFRNCYISEENDLTKTPGGWCRMWGGGNTGLTLLYTVLQNGNVIQGEPWNDMGNGTAPSAATKLHEYGTTLPNGTPVAPKGPDSTKMTQEQAEAVDVESYFGGWEPVYYTAETASTVAVAENSLTVTDNGDINLPHPGHTLTVKYTLTPEDTNANDISVIEWFAVKDGTPTKVKTAAANTSKTYQIQESDVGSTIKVKVTPKTVGGLTGEAAEYTVAEYVREGYDDPSGVVDPELGTGVNIFLAGDSTVKDYSAGGMWNKGANQTEGSWGEWLPKFFNEKVTVVNYAQGGRTTRSFIEDDHSLDKIDTAMKKGDFLFVQFGHNDCYTQDNRYVPLLGIGGAAQKSYAEGGSYPDKVTFTQAQEATTHLTAGEYTTYTGYLKEYVKTAAKNDATCVLMTPVSRMQFNSDGTVKNHHDAKAIESTDDNEYCKAVKWVYDWAKAQPEYADHVVFIDNFQLTADLFTKSYKDAGNANTYAKQLMGINEGTHNGKLGGLIWAGVVAQAIQNSGMSIAKAVVAPTRVEGKTPDNETAFTVSASGVLAAFDNQNGFVDHATYWEGYGAELFAAIAAKADALNSPVQEEVKSMGTVTVKDENDQDVQVELKVTVKWAGEAEDDEDRDPADAAEQEAIGTVTVNVNVPALETIFAACWDEDGAFLGVKLLKGDVKKVALESGWSKVKLIWAVNETIKPKCDDAVINR